MKVEIKELVVMFCDNTSAINISKNVVMHSKTKHIAIKYHSVRELVSDKIIDWNMSTQRNKLLTYSLSHYLRMHYCI